ncbi:MAG: phosphodiesterase [Erysipelotrichaceae bacterium]|nr:phosphodiesterase [Erysipelotrichaceae bacterium]MDY5252597.1 phosphodiesterase [Erysipelotrichaceae bacterium]
MKYLVISDIHGAKEGALCAIEAFQLHHCDMIICLGDILYHGPRNDLPASYAPKEVIKLLNPLKDKIIAVRGNCDAEVDQMVLDFPILADYNILYINDIKFFLTHGHHYGPQNEPCLNPEDYLLSGHTHIPTVDDHLLNPGSISLAKNGHPNSYGIIDEDSFKIYDQNHQLYMQTNLR